MASWLNVQEKARGRDSQDIRKFIRVHGKIITSSSQTESRERDSDDFSTQPPSTAEKPTKQLTLAHFNKKKLPHSKTSGDKADKEAETKSSEYQRLFLPAVKFSTGVRQKAKKIDVEENKENVASQETKPKRRVGQSPSPLRRVNHKSPCSVQKKRKRERLLPLSQAYELAPGTQRESEVIIESPSGFLSSRKKTLKNRGQFSGEASRESAGELTSQVATLQRGEHSYVKKDKDEERGRNLQEDDSDLYINTDELLEGLSNCEKTLINAHTHNNNNNIS